ncbi:hypothetical protein C8R46DRAFT_1215457 [Mycena filopes]|nr:hypothetical protein C8R46DRAFT_1215457 [Mycena filopes]
MSMISPPWSQYTVRRRVDIVHLQQSYVNILEAELTFRQRQRRNQALEDRRLDELDGVFLTSHYDIPDDSGSEDESDTDYTLPGGGPINTAVRGYVLRPRIRPPLADITPIPPVFTAESIEALGFRTVRCDETCLLADLEDRIGGFFFGPPCEHARWMDNIRLAGRAMYEASADLNCARLDGDSIRSGIEYDPVLQRPRKIDRAQDMDNIMVVACLRCSTAVQKITSYQNALMHEVAPRLWADAEGVIQEILANDSSLHAPMQLSNFGPHQPSAFSEVEYRFSTDSVPSTDTGGHPPGFRAITAIGDYDASEGKLILWGERTIVEFPAGSTFLFAGDLVRYSFTKVEKGRQMLITQACGAGLHGFEDRYRTEPWLSKAERKEVSVEEIAFWPTVEEYNYGYACRHD